MKMIPYGKQDINSNDIQEVIKVLKSDFITQGPVLPIFEKEISNFCKSKYSVAINSATSGLHLSCLALGLNTNDYLWTSPISFVASANCGIYCGANIDFIDIDQNNFNIDTNLLEEKLIQANKNNKLPKIIVVVHMCGQSADMEKIFNLGKKYGFKIIEDASHGFGGSYKNQLIGNCRYSDITVFSFHPVKIITTGEGGAVTTNNIDIFQKVRILRSHGITKDKECFINKNEGDWYYEQQYLGFNYRLTDLQAALGVSQIKRTKEFISKRREISRRYNELLNGLPIITPKQENYSLSSWHLYVIRIKSNLSKKSHDEIFHTLREKNILVNLHYIPIHLQPFYKKLGFKKGDFPKAEKYYREAISLPIYYSLSFEEQDYVINTLKNILT